MRTRNRTFTGILPCRERGEELVDIEFTVLVRPGCLGSRDGYGLALEPDEPDDYEVIESSVPMTEEEEVSACEMAQAARR